jgi:hypothetical protein
MGVSKRPGCPACDYRNTAGHIQRHYKAHHGGRLPEQPRIARTGVCNICHETRAYSSMARHKRLKHNVQPSRSPLARPSPYVELTEASISDDTPSSDNNTTTSAGGEEVARVDAAIREIQSFLQNGESEDTNQELRRKLEAMLPVLEDNLGGNWKVLDTISSIALPSQSYMRVLETTNDELVAFCDGNTLPNDVGCLVIRRDLTIPQHRARLVQRQMATFHQEDSIEGQNYGRGNHPTTPYLVLDHLARHERRQQDSVCQQLGACSDTPRNLLSLSGKLAGSISEPASVVLLGYTLLSTLTLEIQAHYGRRMNPFGNVAGKEHIDVPWLSDLASCLRFCLFGDRFSVSLPHLDVLNGTWVTCLSGCKLWFVYDGPWDEERQATFRDEGQHWMPTGELKLVLLRPGDTFIMRPGHPVIHAVLTLDDSIMVGGMIWPESGLKELAESMTYIAKNFPTTNEHVPRQLPEFIDAILRLGNNTRHFGALNHLRPSITTTDLEAIQAFKKELYSTLACECADGECGSKCPCKKETKERVAGCSAWCHPNYDGFQLAAGQCKPIYCNCKQGCGGHCKCKRNEVDCSDRCHRTRGGTECHNP